MKFLFVAVTFTLACHAQAEVRRVKQLENINGIEYIDTKSIFEDKKTTSIAIRDLVATSPPKKGVAYRVRVVNWEPNGKIRSIWTYQLKFNGGLYEFQTLNSSKTKVDVKLGDSVLYYTAP